MEQELGKERFHAIKTVTATSDFYKMDLDGLVTEESAFYLFERTKELMRLQEAKIKLVFHDRLLNKESNDTLFSKIRNLFKLKKARVGLYREGQVFDVISLDIKSMPHSGFLIGVIVHELSHRLFRLRL